MDDMTMTLRYLWNEHANDLGDWCPWSAEVAEGGESLFIDGGDDSCPAGCARSRVEEVEAT